MIYNNDKKQTEAIKGFLKPHTAPNVPKAFGKVPTRSGPAGNPANRQLPIRGQ